MNDPSRPSLEAFIRHEMPFTVEFTLPSTVSALDVARRDEAGTALQTHQLVGQAVGILMERYQISQERALHCLTRVAAAGERDLSAVARRVVDRVNARARSELSHDDPNA